MKPQFPFYPKHVLLADDDSDDRMLFREALNEIDPKIQLSHAADGRELLQLLSSVRELPDLIFLDLNMPRMSGLECLSEIRRSPEVSSLPVGILSTSATDHAMTEAMRLGASFYAVKPDSFSGLRNLIASLLYPMGGVNSYIPATTR